jgi:hypothetical protein
LNILEVRTAEPSQKHSPFGLVQQHASACLTIHVKMGRASAGRCKHVLYICTEEGRSCV